MVAIPEYKISSTSTDVVLYHGSEVGNRVLAELGDASSHIVLEDNEGDLFIRACFCISRHCVSLVEPFELRYLRETPRRECDELCSVFLTEAFECVVLSLASYDQYVSYGSVGVCGRFRCRSDVFVCNVCVDA